MTSKLAMCKRAPSGSSTCKAPWYHMPNMRVSTLRINQIGCASPTCERGRGHREQWRSTFDASPTSLRCNDSGGGNLESCGTLNEAVHDLHQLQISRKHSPLAQGVLEIGRLVEPWAKFHASPRLRGALFSLSYSSPPALCSFRASNKPQIHGRRIRVDCRTDWALAPQGLDHIAQEMSMATMPVVTLCSNIC